MVPPGPLRRHGPQMRCDGRFIGRNSGVLASAERNFISESATCFWGEVQSYGVRNTRHRGDAPIQYL